MLRLHWTEEEIEPLRGSDLGSRLTLRARCAIRSRSSQANHFVAIMPGGDPDARRAAPDQQHFVMASLTGSERQSALSPLADMRTNGPLPCRCLGPRPPRTKGILQNCSTVQAVFYFVLLLPQFGSASANTRDFAPKVRIAHKHWIESDFRETQ